MSSCSRSNWKTTISCARLTFRTRTRERPRKSQEHSLAASSANASHRVVNHLWTRGSSCLTWSKVGDTLNNVLPTWNCSKISSISNSHSSTRLTWALETSLSLEKNSRAVNAIEFASLKCRLPTYNRSTSRKLARHRIKQSGCLPKSARSKVLSDCAQTATTLQVMTNCTRFVIITPQLAPTSSFIDVGALTTGIASMRTSRLAFERTKIWSKTLGWAWLEDLSHSSVRWDRRKSSSQPHALTTRYPSLQIIISSGDNWSRSCRHRSKYTCSMAKASQPRAPMMLMGRAGHLKTLVEQRKNATRP